MKKRSKHAEYEKTGIIGVNKNKMEISKRKAIFHELNDYCIFANKNDYMEVTKWSNEEGVDVILSAVDGNQRFAFTWGQFDLLKKMIKKIEK